MKTYLNAKTHHLILLALTFFFALSCSNDTIDSNSGKLNVSAKSTFGNLASKSSNTKEMSRMAVNITIDDFLINLSKFELEVDLEDDNYHDDENEHWDDDGFYDYDDEIELMGPFELDLMSGQISFLNINVPFGNYDELEFKFDVSTDSASDLFGKSVLIRGNIDGTPFIFWHNFDDELEVDFEDPEFDITVTQISEGVVIDFDLGQILDSVNGVDLSLAQDGNNDGIIEISPEDLDGNNEMAEAIRNKIKEYVNLLDD